MKFLSLQVLLVCVCPSILSFRLSQIARFQSSKLYSSNNQDQQKQVSSSILSNNKYFSKVIASTLGLILTIASPAYAFGELESANNKLSTYGLPPILFVPPNFTPIVSEYGRGSAKEQMTNPVVVEFSHPSLWVTASTTVNNNGESGTISANGN